MDTTVILGDFQAPYHDPDAVEVALQIAETVRPTTLILNGDFADFHTCGRWPVVPSAQVLDDFSEELERCRTLLKAVRKRIPVRDCRFNSGNHEWRLERLFMRDSQLVRILGEKRIADATSIRTLLDFDALKIKFTGQYPTGTWLKPEGSIPDEKNCYVEHGYMTRKKAGYTASALLGERMTNVITGHVERMAVVYQKVVGNRRFFAAEGGNLSRIAEPGKGDKIYAGVPFSEPQFLNHQQGIVVLYHDQGNWFPYCIPIHNGRAVWNGRLYKA